MKKTALLFVLLSLMLIVGCACAQEAETYHIVMRYFPLYIGSVNNAWGNPFPLYFINGVNDVLCERLELDDVTEALDKGVTDWGKLKNIVKDALSDYIWKKTKRRPMIMPIIMDTNY